MKPRRAIAMAGAIVLVALAGTALPLFASAEFVGSGRRGSETRTLGEFTQVRVAGSVDLEARVGAPQSVVVEGDDNLLANVSTEIDKGVLVVAAKESYSTRLGLRVKIVAPRLEGVAIAGSGDAVIEGVKTPSFRIHVAGSGDAVVRGATDDLDVTVHGSGDVTFSELAAKKVAVTVMGSGDVRLRGTTDDLTVDIHGSGDVNCADLRAKQVQVTIAGSGDAQVYAAESLEANVFGSGDLTYDGEPPRVKRSVTGSGEILKR